MFNRILILDAETRWSKKSCDWAPDGYSLSSITTEEYIRSPLFKSFGFCYSWYGESSGIFWVSGEDLQQFFDGIVWETTAVCCHNAMFDVGILAWHYGKKPAFIFDTLSMARAVRGIEFGNSAAKLAADFGLQEKGRATQSTDGLWELTPKIELELAEYCKHDVWLCEQFLDRLLPHFTKGELNLIDTTIRMFTEPQLLLDGDMLKVALNEEEQQRTDLLTRLNVIEADLASADKFANLLRAVGVEPPTKISRQTKKIAYAFAKTDAMFQAIANGDNENAVLLCQARLKVKSTQQRTRAQRFLDISKRGMLPVPVNYAGTRTLRWAGIQQLNMQNLKRGSALRNSILAPEGYQCVVGDLSQIEPRVLAMLSDYAELIDIFESGQDSYAAFGAQMFGIPGLSKTTHPDLRQSAKSALLGAGYGLGWANFAAQLLTGFLGAPPIRYGKEFMKQLGIGGDAVRRFVNGPSGAARVERMETIPHTCTDEELFIHCVCAKEIIDRYRAASKPVVEFWEFLSKMLATVLADPEATPVRFKCLTFAPGRIEFPNGLAVLYDSIECELDDLGRPQYSYWNGKVRKHLYSGIIAENVTSTLARCVMGDGMNRLRKKYRVALTVHDEVVIVVMNKEVEGAMKFMKDCLTKEPEYLPGIPLGAEIGAHQRYGLAKK